MNTHRNLLPNIILSVILISIVVFCTSCSIRAEASEPTQDQEQIPLIEEVKSVQTVSLLSQKDLVSIEEVSLNELKLLIEDCEKHKDAAHLMAEGARALGYPENHPVIVTAKREWHEANNKQKEHQARYDKLSTDLIRQQMAEYPAATTIWQYLKNLGYNDYVCAGILGNIMVEVGGQTLDIQYWLYDPAGAFYGMCQWSKSYYPEVQGADLATQCDFLANTIKFEIDTFGYAYKRNFDYSAFLALENERDAALAFAKAYERCAASTYSIRQNSAEIAYDYFVN